MSLQTNKRSLTNETLFLKTYPCYNNFSELFALSKIKANNFFVKTNKTPYVSIFEFMWRLCNDLQDFRRLLIPRIKYILKIL